MTLGENIAALRTERGLSQEELADMLGVSRQSVSKWETDASVPDLDKLMKLGEIFKVSLDILVKGNAFTGEAAAGEQTADRATVAAVGETGRERASVGLAGNRRAGYIYLVIGAMITIMLGLYGGFLAGVIFGLPFYICTIICLTSKGRRTWLWCGWGLFFVVDLYLRYATGLSWGTVFLTARWTPQMNYMRLAIAWAQFLMMMAFIVITALSWGREPWKEGWDGKPAVLTGIVGLVVTTFVLWLVNRIMYQYKVFHGAPYAILFLSRTGMDYCRMLLAGWTAGALLRFRERKRAQTERGA